MKPMTNLRALAAKALHDCYCSCLGTGQLCDQLVIEHDYGDEAQAVLDALRAARAIKDTDQLVCGHCGRSCGDLAGGYGSAYGVALCHPNEPDRPDCYRLVTMLSHPIPCTPCWNPEEQHEPDPAPVAA